MPAGNPPDAFAFRRAAPHLRSAAVVLLAGGSLSADETASALQKLRAVMARLETGPQQEPA